MQLCLATFVSDQQYKEVCICRSTEVSHRRLCCSSMRPTSWTSLIGLPKLTSSTLQSVQNAVAKLVAGINRYDRTKPPLEELHWLPIEQHVKFQIVLLCFKALNNQGPDYLKDVLIPYQPTRALRAL